MKIGNKYSPTTSEKIEQITVSEFSEAENAFSNQCCVLVICAYYKIIGERKLLRTWNEDTITRHLKKHLKLCIREAEIQYFIAPEYPEDDAEIEDGLKDIKKEVYFDLIFSSFNNNDQYYFGVEAKIVIENNYLKRIATTEIAEYISNKGMRKFIDGIYKKKGCMIGYVMEGSPTIIVTKINQSIVSNTLYESSAKLSQKTIISTFDHFYESQHIGYNGNPLRHLFMDFTTCDN